MSSKNLKKKFDDDIDVDANADVKHEQSIRFELFYLYSFTVWRYDRCSIFNLTDNGLYVEATDENHILNFTNDNEESFESSKIRVLRDTKI